jgi:3-hydroxyacyl-CoA dehydrogenase
VNDCDLLIEAIVENYQIKKELFEELDKIAPPSVIFCSNTSSLSISTLAPSSRASRFAGLHFFNPVLSMKLVELVRTTSTSDETVDVLKEFVSKLGKKAILCSDSPGFVVNRLLFPYLKESLKALQEGVASKEDIDQAMKLGAGYPMGPFELMDYVGLDTIKYAMGNGPEMKLVEDLINEKKFGKKSGQGFYSYSK